MDPEIVKETYFELKCKMENILLASITEMYLFIITEKYINNTKMYEDITHVETKES